eukprot:15301203-Alexandrium_andersonii.AAC.1
MHGPARCIAMPEAGVYISRCVRGSALGRRETVNSRPPKRLCPTKGLLQAVSKYFRQQKRWTAH